MTPRNSRGVFLLPDEPVGIAQVFIPRTGKDRSVATLEFLTREIAIARDAIVPGCAGSEFQQPSSVAPGPPAQGTGTVTERADDASYSQRPRPRGDVVDPDRRA